MRKVIWKVALIVTSPLLCGIMLQAAPARYTNTAFGFSIVPPPSWKIVPADHFKVSFVPIRDREKIRLGIAVAVVPPKQTAHEYLRQIAGAMGAKVSRATPLSPQLLRSVGATEGLGATLVGEGESKEGKTTDLSEDVWIFKKRNRIYTIVLDGEPEARSKRHEEVQKAILSFRIH